jgi:hypothetical protein
MIISITTTTVLNKNKTIVTENVDKTDLRLEMLRDVKSLFNTWRILGYDFNYECSETKFGYKVTKTVKQHKETKELIIQEFKYN